MHDYLSKNTDFKIARIAGLENSVNMRFFWHIMMSSKNQALFLPKNHFHVIEKSLYFLAKTFPNFLQGIIFYLDIILVCARITYITGHSKIKKLTIFKHSGVKSFEIIILH